VCWRLDTAPLYIRLSTPWLLPARSFGLDADERALKIPGDQPAPERVLLNITMPGMDGYAVGRHSKFDFRTRRTPLIHVQASA
jgi:CheY-like chemotaxis protein